MTMQNALVQQLADETGDVQIDSETTAAPEIDLSVNIRDDNFQLFESDGNELYIKTPDMPDGLFAEVIPTSEGPITQVVTEIEESGLTLCEPADRAEQDDVASSESTQIIVD